MTAMRPLVLVLLVACSGAADKSTSIKIEPTPPPATRAVLAGPLCGGESGACTCRDPGAAADGGAGLAEGGRKRFELRIGPTDNDLWATVDGQVLYKSKERATDCFYLDLAEGEHQVTLRASRSNGAQVALQISEYGVHAKSWYKTFAFSCGVPGTCSHDELDEIKASYRGVKGGIHDACGSVRVKGVGWDTGVAPDQIHPSDIAVGFTLDVYKFRPGKPSGDPSCGTGSTAAPDDEAPAPEGEAPATEDEAPAASP